MFLKGSMFFGPFRNIKIGKPAIGGGLHIGEMVRFQIRTFAYKLGGRVTNTLLSVVRVPNGRHEGQHYFTPGCISDPPLPSHCRIVCIDIRKLRWCSVDSVAFHWFVWPTSGREVKSIARTLYANHCDWADVLIVRGRCFRSSKVGLWANRALESLIWNWSSMRRPYVVFTEGRQGIRYVDLVPAWLERERVCRNLCQCNLLGPRRANWHRYGSMCSNFVRLYHLRFGGFYDGNDCKQRPFLEGCIKNIMNTEIAIKLITLAICALKDAPPSVPQRGESLASVLRSRKFNPRAETHADVKF